MHSFEISSFVAIIFRSNPLSTRTPSTPDFSFGLYMVERSAQRPITSCIMLALPYPLPSIGTLDSTTRRTLLTPWHASTSPRGMTLPWLHRSMLSSRVLCQHGLCRPQNVFADSRTIRRSARAEGRFLVRLAHVFQQLAVLLELFDRLPFVQK